jgi:hypothetical protein
MEVHTSSAAPSIQVMLPVSKAPRRRSRLSSRKPTASAPKMVRHRSKEILGIGEQYFPQGKQKRKWADFSPPSQRRELVSRDLASIRSREFL